MSRRGVTGRIRGDVVGSVVEMRPQRRSATTFLPSDQASHPSEIATWSIWTEQRAQPELGLASPLATRFG